MTRNDGRQVNQLRSVRIHPHYLEAPAGSVLIEMGRTRVVCAASVENSVPRWMRDQKKPGGWVTAEYSMMPYASSARKAREISRGRPEGRTQEIQRLIGRSLRAVVDLQKLPDHTIWLDCDVLQADGGTRTAAITGAAVALSLAVNKLVVAGQLAENPLRCLVAAVSVGLVDGRPLLDLCYEEDVRATVDANVVMTATGEFVELQASGEEACFAKPALQEMISLAEDGIRQLLVAQQAALA